VEAATRFVEKEQRMSKWIDYDAIDYKHYQLHDKSEEFLNGVVYMAERIEEAPSINIVKCLDCKKSHIDGKTTHYLWCTEWGRSTDTFGYCERGEREGE
jgi:hypothetical protein